MKRYFFLIIACFSTMSFAKEYSFSHDPIDIVIPCHEKDLPTLDLVIEGARNVVNHRRIIIISERKFTDKAEWFDERNFPFDKQSIALEMFNGDYGQAYNYIDSSKSRIGWIYQQFLKLFASFIIPNISPNVLIIDADTIFLRPIIFQDTSGAGLFNPGTEYNPPYFVHGAKVLHGFRKVFPQHSGISHHMLFQRSILEDLISSIQKQHYAEPWRVIARCIDYRDFSGISEYELYFNFAFGNSNQVKIRPLRWSNVNSINSIEQYRQANYDYISCHSWMR